MWLVSLSPRCSHWNTSVSIKSFEGNFVCKRWIHHHQTSLDACEQNNFNLSALKTSNSSKRTFGGLTVVSKSWEVCLVCRVSSPVLVSRGGVPADSWGIWKPREPRCPACKSPCRWPSSRMGLHPFQPQWRWKTLEGSPGPPPEIDQEPDGDRSTK